MSKSKITRELTLLAPGGIIDLVQDESGKFELLKITGNATLTGNLSILSSSTYSVSDVLIVAYNATMDFNGKSVDIFGKTIPPELQSKKLIIMAFYNGSNFDTYILVDPTDPGVIPGLASVEQTITDTEDLAKMIIGQGGSVASKVISGDISIDKDGVAAISAGVIDSSMLNFGLDSSIVGYEKVLTSGQITNLLSSPIEILSDSGVQNGSFISIMSIALSYNYDAASLVLGGDFEISYNDGTSIVDIPMANLIGGSDAIWVINVPGHNTIINSGIQIKAKVDNPTGGGASTTLKVRIYYTETVV